jgi:hypothetical protein
MAFWDAAFAMVDHHHHLQVGGDERSWVGIGGSWRYDGRVVDKRSGHIIVSRIRW